MELTTLESLKREIIAMLDAKGIGPPDSIMLMADCIVDFFAGVDDRTEAMEGLDALATDMRLNILKLLDGAKP